MFHCICLPWSSTPPCSGSMLLQGCPPSSLRTTALEFHIRSYCICVRMHTYTYLPSDFLLRVSASSWTFQREGKGLLLQWLVLLPELPSGQRLSHPCTPAAQLGHQQAQGVKAHARLYIQLLNQAQFLPQHNSVFYFSPVGRLDERYNYCSCDNFPEL